MDSLEHNRKILFWRKTEYIIYNVIAVNAAIFSITYTAEDEEGDADIVCYYANVYSIMYTRYTV